MERAGSIGGSPKSCNPVFCCAARQSSCAFNCQALRLNVFNAPAKDGDALLALPAWSIFTFPICICSVPCIADLRGDLLKAQVGRLPGCIGMPGRFASLEPVRSAPDSFKRIGAPP